MGKCQVRIVASQDVTVEYQFRQIFVSLILLYRLPWYAVKKFSKPTWMSVRLFGAAIDGKGMHRKRSTKILKLSVIVQNPPGLDTLIQSGRWGNIWSCRWTRILVLNLVRYTKENEQCALKVTWHTSQSSRCSGKLLPWILDCRHKQTWIICRSLGWAEKKP